MGNSFANEPIYDMGKSYEENAEKGPFFDGEIPKREPSATSDFLGFQVASRLGVPAGPLLNSNWVILAAKLGFDIVTYKTIRSRTHPAHPLPNMVYIDSKTPLYAGVAPEVIVESKNRPDNMAHLAATNSFGIPSKDPAFLMQDIARANRAMGAGQVMIVSIVGTPREGEDFVQDFVLAARIAKEAGAKIIEADFSCPNVASKEGSIHLDPQAVSIITKAIAQEIGEIPLVIKLGVVREKERLRQVMEAGARAGARAVCGINTVSKEVVKADGTAALGPTRLRAGVCGGPIRAQALQFLKDAVAVNREQKLDLTLMLTGGAVLPEHFDLFFEAGADVAMSAIGMMFDPYLATKYHRNHHA